MLLPAAGLCFYWIGGGGKRKYLVSTHLQRVEHKGKKQVGTGCIMINNVSDPNRATVIVQLSLTKLTNNSQVSVSIFLPLSKIQAEICFKLSFCLFPKFLVIFQWLVCQPSIKKSRVFFSN